MYHQHYIFIIILSFSFLLSFHHHGDEMLKLWITISTNLVTPFCFWPKLRHNDTWSWSFSFNSFLFFIFIV